MYTKVARWRPPSFTGNDNQEASRCAFCVEKKWRLPVCSTRCHVLPKTCIPSRLGGAPIYVSLDVRSTKCPFYFKTISWSSTDVAYTSLIFALHSRTLRYLFFCNIILLFAQSTRAKLQKCASCPRKAYLEKDRKTLKWYFFFFCSIRWAQKKN